MRLSKGGKHLPWCQLWHQAVAAHSCGMGEGRDGQERLMGMLCNDGSGTTYFLGDHAVLLSKPLARL